MYSSSTALRSMIFHRKLLRFFLTAREKAIVRLCEAEASGLHRRLKIVGEKCAAHLGLTDGFQMAVRYPPSGPSDYCTRFCILGGLQLGQPPG
uniref:HINTW n=1 Tax=Phasianus colchicus TaxID=9054 RepID=A0A669QH48_PHACC